MTPYGPLMDPQWDPHFSADMYSMPYGQQTVKCYYYYYYYCYCCTTAIISLSTLSTLLSTLSTLSIHPFSSSRLTCTGACMEATLLEQAINSLPS